MTDRQMRLEALSRLERMARDRGDTWDLTSNDQAAIRRVLDDLTAAEERERALRGALQCAVPLLGIRADTRQVHDMARAALALGTGKGGEGPEALEKAVALLERGHSKAHDWDVADNCGARCEYPAAIEAVRRAARTASVHPASAPPVATVPPGAEAHAKSADVAASAAHGEPEGGER